MNLPVPVKRKLFQAALVLITLVSILPACTQAAGNTGSPAPSFPFDPDLSAWKTASWSPFTVRDSITGFAYGETPAGGIFVAVSITGLIAYSVDGDIWLRALKAPKENPDDPEAPNPFNAEFNAVCYGGGVFIAAGNNGKIARSTDGVYWKAGPPTGINGFGASSINGISCGNGIVVAVGDNANISCSADGGLTWAGGSAPVFGGKRLNAVSFGNGVFYAAGNEGQTGYSNDPAGGSWNHYRYPARNTGTYPDEKQDPGYPFFGGNITKLAWGRYGQGNGIAAVFDEWGGRRIAIATSDDFRGWDADIDAGNFGANQIRGICYGGGYFVAMGTSAMIGFWPSADPSNTGTRYWRAHPFLEFNYWEITAAAACKDRFFAGGIGGKIGYSK
ncbi:MAG: hypothetical protein LBK02_08385 [Treponema sp.]|jgi:hypothetical protein|nr:hypothetical protein [Treponema sp.]